MTPQTKNVLLNDVDIRPPRAEPIMGGGYHLIHHTTYKHNYGHYFTYMDKMFGSLLSPTEYENMRKKKN